MWAYWHELAATSACTWKNCGGNIPFLVLQGGVLRCILGVLLSWGSGKWSHHWPRKTWSKVNNAAFHCYFNNRKVSLGPHSGMCSSTQTCKRLKIKVLQCEIVLYDLLTSFHFTHEQISFFSPAYHNDDIMNHNSNAPRSKRVWILKGMGDDSLIGLLHVMPKTHLKLLKTLSVQPTILNHTHGPFFLPSN